MTLTKKQEIEICDYWLNNPEKDCPINIDGYNRDDVESLCTEVFADNIKLPQENIKNYKSKIEREQREAEGLKIQKKSASYKRAILIAIISGIIGAFFSNIDRIIK